MTNSEISEEAARRVKAIMNSHGEYNNRLALLFMLTFADAAQWRINSVWHDNSVNPELPDEPILYVDRNGSCGVLRKGYFNKTKEPWITVCSLYRILIWAYIKDLIPTEE